jgi:hypothetical protein
LHDRELFRKRPVIVLPLLSIALHWLVCVAVLMTGVALYDQRLSFSLEKDSKRSNQIHVLLASMSYHVDSVQFILI